MFLSHVQRAEEENNNGLSTAFRPQLYPKMVQKSKSDGGYAEKTNKGSAVEKSHISLRKMILQSVFNFRLIHLHYFPCP